MDTARELPRGHWTALLLLVFLQLSIADDFKFVNLFESVVTSSSDDSGTTTDMGSLAAGTVHNFSNPTVVIGETSSPSFLMEWSNYAAAGRAFANRPTMSGTATYGFFAIESDATVTVQVDGAVEATQAIPALTTWTLSGSFSGKLVEISSTEDVLVAQHSGGQAFVPLLPVASLVLGQCSGYCELVVTGSGNPPPFPGGPTLGPTIFQSCTDGNFGFASEGRITTNVLNWNGKTCFWSITPGYQLSGTTGGDGAGNEGVALVPADLLQRVTPLPTNMQYVLLISRSAAQCTYGGSSVTLTGANTIYHARLVSQPAATVVECDEPVTAIGDAACPAEFGTACSSKEMNLISVPLPTTTTTTSVTSSTVSTTTTFTGTVTDTSTSSATITATTVTATTASTSSTTSPTSTVTATVTSTSTTSATTTSPTTTPTSTTSATTTSPTTTPTSTTSATTTFTSTTSTTTTPTGTTATATPTSSTTETTSGTTTSSSGTETTLTGTTTATSTASTTTTTSATSTASSTTSSLTSTATVSSTTVSTTSTTSTDTSSATAAGETEAPAAAAALVDIVESLEASLLPAFLEGNTTSITLRVGGLTLVAVKIDAAAVEAAGGSLTVTVEGSEVTVTVPASLFAHPSIDEEGVVLTVAVVDPTSEGFPGGGGESEVQVASVVNVNLHLLAGSRLRVTGLVDPIKVVMPVNESEGLQCVFWDEASSGWASKGVVLGPVEEGTVECRCSHLTLFAAIFRGFVNTFACSQLVLLNAESLRELGRGDWHRAPGAVVLWLMLTTFALLLCRGAWLDWSRRKQGRTSDEHFLIPLEGKREEDVQPEVQLREEEVLGEEEEKEEPCEKGGSGHGNRAQLRLRAWARASAAACAASEALLANWCRSSGVLRDALDEVVSQWAEYFGEIRDFVEGLTEGLELCGSGALRRDLAIMVVHRLMSAALVLSARRQAAASLGISCDVSALVMEDEDMFDVLLAHHTRKPEKAVAEAAPAEGPATGAAPEEAAAEDSSAEVTTEDAATEDVADAASAQEAVGTAAQGATANSAEGATTEGAVAMAAAGEAAAEDAAAGEASVVEVAAGEAATREAVAEKATIEEAAAAGEAAAGEAAVEEAAVEVMAGEAAAEESAVEDASVEDRDATRAAPQEGAAEAGAAQETPSGNLPSGNLPKSASHKTLAREEAWAQLHREVEAKLDAYMEASGDWSSLPSTVWRLFLHQNPFSTCLVHCAFTSCKLRVLLFMVDVVGALMLTTFFFAAAGVPRKRSRALDCSFNDPFEFVGRVLAIGTGSLLIASIPAVVLGSLCTRGFRKFDYEGCPAWNRQLEVWRAQDRAIWVISLLYLAFCLFFACLFLANVDRQDQGNWLLSGFVSVVESVVVIPLAVALALPLLAAACLHFVSRHRKATKAQLISERHLEFKREGNMTLPIVKV